MSVSPCSPEDAELLIPKKSDLQLIKVAAPSRQGLGRVHSRGLHSSTFRLKLSASCGIGGAARSCVGVV